MTKMTKEPKETRGVVTKLKVHLHTTTVSLVVNCRMFLLDLSLKDYEERGVWMSIKTINTLLVQLQYNTSCSWEWLQGL